MAINPITVTEGDLYDISNMVCEVTKDAVRSHVRATDCVGGPKGAAVGTIGVARIGRNYSHLCYNRNIISRAVAMRKDGQHHSATERGIDNRE